MPCAAENLLEGTECPACTLSGGSRGATQVSPVGPTLVALAGA